MKRLLPLFVFVFLCGLSLFLAVPTIFSDELDDINKQINDFTKALEMSKAATAPLETELSHMRSQITDIKQRVAAIEEGVAVKKKNIDQGYKNLAKQETVLNSAIRDFYVKSYYNSPLAIFLSGSSATQITQLLAYQKAATDQDKAIITNIALSIQALEIKKQNLENEQRRLTAVKASLDQQETDLNKVVLGAKAYQATLTTQIAQLSTRQQELLAQKLAALNIPKSAYAGLGGGCVDDRGIDPGFSPRFALFTYGVPNRIGLNQYGAKGRAEAGQNAETILSAYYGNYNLEKSYNTSINVHVVGTNEYGQSFDDNWDIETYVKHLYEMPTNWQTEALKAQAVAARSYALSATNNGQASICPSQQCQVVKKEINSDTWQHAVDDTRGWVITSGGQPIKAWFSSTHGGYVFSSGDIGWSGTAWTKNALDATGNVSSFSDLQNNAYDKGSPWFYCDWGSRSQYNKTAWLRSEELADIVNVLMLAKNDSSTQKHLAQVDKTNPDGVDTWDSDRVKQECRNRGIAPYNTISDLNIDWDKGSGKTTSVTLSGDSGSKSFSGSEFKDYFNLRAPANIQIVGPLYNAEKR